MFCFPFLVCCEFGSISHHGELQIRRHYRKATKQGWKICALPATKEELEIAWPDTKFHFGISGAGSYHSLIDEWDNGRCKAIVYGFANLELMNMLCKRDLVITKSVALENPVAWPIRPSYSAGLSYWMYEADKKYGLKVESIKEKYDAKAEQPSCNVRLVRRIQVQMTMQRYQWPTCSSHSSSLRVLPW